MTVASPVLILGAGVHGAAIALDLVLNGVPVHVVDKFDIAYGATSKSSRLIHGGLRYLEYGDFKLVKESLQARQRNLELAPQFVQPLQFHIPTNTRWSGLLRSAAGFLGFSRTTLGQQFTPSPSGRGYWPVTIGLMMYGSLSGTSSTVPIGTAGIPRVNSARYRWLSTYTDAQMLFPERLVVSLLADAWQVAQSRGVPFQLSTYSLVEYEQGQWRIRDRLTNHPAVEIQPACVVNSTGAWGDNTLEQLQVKLPPLFGGTKGTHFVTWNVALHDALQGQAVYAEADDGRLVFILPFGDGVLVGTTDETFAAQPEMAAATEEELQYLMRLVNEVMACQLTRDDITLHYSGVRPLPKSTSGTNASVSRDHSLLEQVVNGCPVITLVGGKLTTWREFGHEVSDHVLRHLNRERLEETVWRPVLGAENRSTRVASQIPHRFPMTDAEQIALWRDLAEEFHVPMPMLASLWPLYGWRTMEILEACRGDFGWEISGTSLTSNIVCWVIDQEWVRTLSDLIERRLMLVFARDLRRQTLIDLAGCLVEKGKLASHEKDSAVTAVEERLLTFYGRKLG